MNISKLVLVLFISIVLVTACNDEEYIPKPRGYFNIEFPEKKYQEFYAKDYPYRFEYPTYATFVKDTLFFNEKTENPWWINLDFTSLGGKVYISYKTIDNKQNLQKLLEDSYQLSHYHTKKADYINEPEFHTPHNVHGIFYEVGGNAASAFQFYATDSVKHFLRGALYFDTTPNADSLQPVNDFLVKDLLHLIETLQWN